MSRLLIHQYYAEVDKLIQYGGSRNESNITGAFERLLNEYCKTRDFLLIPKLDYRTKSGKPVYPDGTVKDALRLDWGYWESKDEYDNLDQEIEYKLNSKGYPNDNIIFEDSRTAVLIQRGEERLRVPVRDAEKLDHLLNAFINYVRPEVKDFRIGIETFKSDLPTIIIALRDLIDRSSESNPTFVQYRDAFLQVCRDSINPEVTLEDVREMMIQHILTEDIFISIFNESQFHRENNIARELQGVIDTFFTGSVKRNTLSTIERYYAVIRRTAASIYNHHEKQRFLKSVYENFYKAYNPKAADRLGIVYTPNEIVRFMIESVDYLVHQHFGKVLADPGVEILDPATGTGTFITELIEYLPKDKLTYKYQNEIHCNEVAILPYYIANLNIEFTYKQKMEEYLEFNNICFVDTLDHTSFAGKQMDLFAMSVENTERIKRQNDKTISVIIGNPPYNAKQENFSHNNANRKYESIDKRIKDTYVREGTAQNQNYNYDMYIRFIRWATDRLGDNGILAFVTNSSFIDAIALDGFRKVIAQEFSELYVIDLGGNIREGDKTGNVFNVKVGIAISFMIKKNNPPQESRCRIVYFSADSLKIDGMKYAKEKLNILSQNKIEKIDFISIIPDDKYTWINQSNNDFNKLVSLISKNVKTGKTGDSLFKLYSVGVQTNRDDWVYDIDKTILAEKIVFFIQEYNKCVDNNMGITNNTLIKWTSSLQGYFQRKIKANYNPNNIIFAIYRPFCKKFLYADSILNHRLTENHYTTFGKALDKPNRLIWIKVGSEWPFFSLAVKHIPDMLPQGGSQFISIDRYDKDGNRVDNITDWGLEQFQNHYNERTITKENIFHYTYAVLHNPDYRRKYELNLKREFPRIPFYENFPRWTKWGKDLMELHIHYETVEPYPLVRIDIPLEKGTPKPKLKADQTQNLIILDDITTLSNLPSIAWQYRLGNRCALEWILDQYKEKKPKDKTIAEKFPTYRFADYKETVIDLLTRVCTVSAETMKIIAAMENP